jgi:hypothetical protein
MLIVGLLGLKLSMTYVLERNHGRLPGLRPIAFFRAVSPLIHGTP